MKGVYAKYNEGGMMEDTPQEETKEVKEFSYTDLMDHLIDKKGGTVEKYEDLMNAIAFHESGPKQRMSASAIQISKNKETGELYDGPARGLFQFEKGPNEAGETAVTRTIEYFKKNNLTVPQWVKDLDAKEAGTLDFSELPEEQQRFLFITNYLQHPTANLGKIADGTQSYNDFWAKYHHAGGSTTDHDRFSESLSAYEKWKASDEGKTYFKEHFYYVPAEEETEEVEEEATEDVSEGAEDSESPMNMSGLFGMGAQLEALLGGSSAGARAGAAAAAAKQSAGRRRM